MNSESLHFKIGLSGSSNKKNPEFNIILVNNNVSQNIITQKTLSLSCNETEYFEFDAQVDNGDCQLIIEFLNKTVYDTVLNEDNNIIEDLLLNIDSIEIDNIDLGSLLWTASHYNPIYPQAYAAKANPPKSVKNCVNLGWNGQWILPFQIPFYIWLLEYI